MQYAFTAIADSEIPRSAEPIFQHLLDTYASETNKVISVWRGFNPADLTYRPHPKSSTVADILKHQLLSERRFFGEFVGTPEPEPAEVLPATVDLDSCITRMVELVRQVERGTLLATAELASRLERWRQSGSDLAFIIGGPDGLAETVKRGAAFKWSLSPLTLPHGLARVVLAEQLYRAVSILHNHPYHRE